MESTLLGKEIPESTKLQGASHYAIRAYKIRTLLQGENLWQVVSPVIQPSSAASWSHNATSQISSEAESTPTGAHTTITPLTAPSFVASPHTAPLSAFNLENQRYKATQSIVPTVKESILPHVMNMIDPRWIWIKLRELYESSSMNQRLSLMSQLYSLKMTEKTSLESHLASISTLVGQLANI